MTMSSKITGIFKIEFQFFAGVKTSNDCNHEYQEEKNSIISLICVSMPIVVRKTTSNINDIIFS